MIFMAGISVPISAESFFLKNGSIVEGEIANETGAVIQVRKADGSRENIPRADLLRTLFTDDYKKLVYIYRKDGSMVRAHVVEEDRKYYYLREDLASPRETTIPRSEVKIISDVAVDTGEKSVRTYAWVSLSFAGLTLGGIAAGAACQVEFSAVKKDHSRMYRYYLMAGDVGLATFLHYRLEDKKKLGDAYSLGGNISYSLGLAFSAVSIITGAIFIYKYIQLRKAQGRDAGRHSFNPLENLYGSVDVRRYPDRHAAYHYRLGISWRF